MKKGFTMIELIFVIVILGILASVAIPRLAGTRTDAEVATTVANLRTLLSDLNSYYVVKGTFGTDNTGKSSTIKWNEITNVPIKPKDDSKGVYGDGILKVGDQDCILVALRDRTVTATGSVIPAYIVFLKKSGDDVGDVCTQVQNAAPVQAYFDSRVENLDLGNGTNKGAIAIGSSTTIY